MPSNLQTQLNSSAKAFSGKRTKSILFSNTDDVDSAQILNLARNGLLQLSIKEGRFSSFLDSLLAHSDSNHVEFLAPDQRILVDAQINLLLSLLSPHLLNQNALKVLEWLIRRYKVCDRNVHAILLMAIPYHESQLFVNLVALCVLPPTWSFLKKLQTSKVLLDRVSLVKQCIADPKVIDALFETVFIFNLDML